MQRDWKVLDIQEEYTVLCHIPRLPHLLVANTPSVSDGSAAHGHRRAESRLNSVMGHEKLRVTLNAATRMGSTSFVHGGSTVSSKFIQSSDAE